jgi:FtsH-binding integral membrane protein
METTLVAGKVARAGLRWRSLMWILLLVPFIGLLWVPFYNSPEPALFGFPFFYWYQFAWVPITSFLIWLVYRSRPRDEPQ